MSLLKFLPAFTRNLLPKINTPSIITNNFHLLLANKPTTCKTTSTSGICCTDGLLTAPSVNVAQSCGYKVKILLKKRCRHCFFVMRDQRLYVKCKTNPRHKQMSVVKKEKNTWILSHATQGQVRPW